MKNEAAGTKTHIAIKNIKNSVLKTQRGHAKSMSLTGGGGGLKKCHFAMDKWTICHSVRREGVWILHFRSDILFAWSRQTHSLPLLAIQPISHQLPFSLHSDKSTTLKNKSVFRQQVIHSLCDLYSVRHAGTVHPARNVHRIPPDVVLRFLRPYNNNNNNNNLLSNADYL